MYLSTIICILLAIAVIILLIKIYLMKRSAKEIAEKLAEKLSEDTNTLLDISSGDKDMRMLADTLNTELKELRRRRNIYEEGDRELKNAVTAVSHDLRTPLTAVCGYLELLRREETSEKVRKYLGCIENRTEAMKQLTGELFGYSVISSGGMGSELHFEKICLNAALEESLADFYGAIAEKGIEPETDITETRVERELDMAALKRIFGNIISNAVKYSDGDFFVKMTDDGSMSFSNTASGLNAVTVARLFDRFYTVETGGDSTGLGLSIAKQLTSRMGGSIRAEYINGRVVIILEF